MIYILRRERSSGSFHIHFVSISANRETTWSMRSRAQIKSKTRTQKKCQRRNLFFGKSAFCAKRTCGKENKTRGSKMSVVAACCVLAAFMAARRKLPGKKAFVESLKLGKKLKGACESFVNAATIVEKSELSEYVRVREIMDVCVQYSEMAEDAEDGDETHSFVTHKQMSLLLETFPLGSVGMSITESDVQVFYRNGKVYDSILGDTEGTWTMGVGHDELSVLPSDGDRTELMILEPVSNSLI